MLWLCDHRGRAGLRWLSAVRELSRGVGGGGGGSHAWDVLLEIRCADSKPHGPWEWGAPSYLYTITFGRHCPYGPLMWRGGRCVVPHDRPGCVWRRHAGQLPERQHEQALARTVPARAVDTEWRALCVEPHGPGAQTGGWRSARRVYHTRLFWGPPGRSEGWQDTCLHDNHGGYDVLPRTQEEEGRRFRDDWEIDGAIVALENCRGT